MRFDICLLVFLMACIFTKYNESPHPCKLTLSEILQSLQDCLHTALVSENLFAVLTVICPLNIILSSQLRAFQASLGFCSVSCSRKSLGRKLELPHRSLPRLLCLSENCSETDGYIRMSVFFKALLKVFSAL